MNKYQIGDRFVRKWTRDSGVLEIDRIIPSFSSDVTYELHQVINEKIKKRLTQVELDNEYYKIKN